MCQKWQNFFEQINGEPWWKYSYVTFCVHFINLTEFRCLCTLFMAPRTNGCSGMYRNKSSTRCCVIDPDQFLSDYFWISHLESLDFRFLFQRAVSLDVGHWMRWGSFHCIQKWSLFKGVYTVCQKSNLPVNVSFCGIHLVDNVYDYWTMSWQ